MSNTNNSIFTTVITIAGLVGIGHGLACHNKMTKVSQRLDKTIDSIADDMEIDISEELVKKAVDKAVTSAVKSAVDKATTDAVIAVRGEIRRDVSAAVEKEYESIKDNVLKEITVSASKIDVDKVRREVEKAAEKAALAKFDANLDGILQKFNNDLDNTAKVYSTIKSMMTPAPTANTGREFVVRMG